MTTMAHPYQTTYQSAAELNQAFGPGVSAHAGQSAQPPQQQQNQQGPSPFSQQQAAQAQAAHYHQLSAPSSPALPPYASHDPTGHQTQDPSGSRVAKRKPVGGDQDTPSMGKRRKAEEDDGDDDAGGGGGLKHWTDDDKTKLFTWLMGPGQDEHFNALRASKNSCLRECAQDAFGGKKSFQALKGALERAFATFKQIYAFEAYTANMRAPAATLQIQGERHRDWERRIQAARKNGFDLGSVSVRLLEQWHKTGWYQLFYSRWHGDPQTTKPISRLQNQPNVPDDDRIDEHDELMPDPPSIGPPLGPNEPERQMSVLFAPPPPSLPPAGVEATPPASVSAHTPFFTGPPPSGMGPPPSMNGTGPPPPGPPMPMTPIPQPPPTGIHNGPPPPPGTLYPTDATLSALASLTQSMMSSYVQLLKTQAQDGAIKMEYLRRREEREEADARAVRERERRATEREQADWEHAREAERVKQKVSMAKDLLDTANDPGVKAAAADFLKKLFSS